MQPSVVVWHPRAEPPVATTTTTLLAAPPAGPESIAAFATGNGSIQHPLVPIGALSVLVVALVLVRRRRRAVDADEVPRVE